MELKDFISETLVEITAGVVEAAEKLKQDKTTRSVWVNPPIACKEEIGFTEEAQHSGVLGRVSAHPHLVVLAVDFNLAVTVSDETNGKISVLSAILGVGGSAGASTENKSINSVSFTVPISLPMQKNPYRLKK